MHLTLLYWALLLLHATSISATTEDEPSSAAVQDSAYGMLLQEDRPSSNQLREMMRLYEMIQLKALQAKHNPDLEEMLEGEALPIPERLIAILQENDDLLKQQKRGSYMSLCHFKICNMGRKRNPYWSKWARV
uniref:Somatostatin/Cortistatin C-terminal domain-containing protein n=1 Tax=Clastoptera arizonana TaxID=38151 RepID=A0A1B6C4S4_9HEMI